MTTDNHNLRITTPGREVSSDSLAQSLFVMRELLERYLPTDFRSEEAKDGFYSLSEYDQDCFTAFMNVVTSEPLSNETDITNGAYVVVKDSAGAETTIHGHEATIYADHINFDTLHVKSDGMTDLFIEHSDVEIVISRDAEDVRRLVITVSEGSVGPEIGRISTTAGGRG